MDRAEKLLVLTLFANILLNIRESHSCFPLLQMALVCFAIKRKRLCLEKETEEAYAISVIRMVN